MTDHALHPVGASDVGVVIAARNAAATIGASIESVLAESVPPSCILVVDGASTDRTPDIALGLGVTVVAQDGAGLSAGRNQGVAALDTALVAFCDADDRWAPGSLAARMRHLGSDLDRSAVIGHYVAACVDGRTDTRTEVARQSPRPAWTPGGLLAGRGVFTRVGPFSEALTVGADSDWLVRLSQSDIDVSLIDDVVLIKGVHAGQMSRDVPTYRRELLRVARSFVREARDR
ncbi:MAG: glycosyltransferase [Actinomycetota bacterium]